MGLIAAACVPSDNTRQWEALVANAACCRCMTNMFDETHLVCVLFSCNQWTQLFTAIRDFAKSTNFGEQRVRMCADHGCMLNFWMDLSAVFSPGTSKYYP